ncbi:type II secretion system F family protein [Patescibacteria group bacterium]
MPSYSYTAKSFKGEIKSGVLEAKDESQLAKILRQEGYLLVKADLLEEKNKKRKLELDLSAIFGIPLVEKMMFTRNLGIMISSGVSFPKALRVLATQSKNEKFKKALLEIMQEVVKGKSFSEGLLKYPDIFSEIFINMIKVGEEAGTLEEILKILTKQMEREHDLKSKIKGAMIYPMVIISAMMGIGILMLIVVVPKLAETFEELAIELPLTTKVIISLGTFLADFWYLIPLIVLALFFLGRMILKTKGGGKTIDTLTLKIPIISSIIKQTNSAYTARILGSLIASGVPIVRSLDITSRALGNSYYKKAISEAAEKVKKGGKLSEALRPYQNIYPLMVIQMIEVGEETGQTSDILEKLADFFEQEVTNATKNLSAVIEPVLMLIVGAAIGFFAISMIQPMYSMLGAI